jgi:hypothetical protein
VAFAVVWRKEGGVALSFQPPLFAAPQLLNARLGCGELFWRLVTELVHDEVANGASHRVVRLVGLILPLVRFQVR